LETRLLLLRHAESAAPDQFHGAESDVGLGAQGRRQAAALAGYLASLKPDGVYSSPMRRALETARMIGEACGVTVEIVPALHEQRMGHLSGTPKAEGWPRYQGQLDEWKRGAADFALPGAESYQGVAARAVPALLDVAKRRPGDAIVVVCHGMVIRVVLTALLAELGIERIEEVGIDTAGINDLRFDGRVWRAQVLNARPFVLDQWPSQESAPASE
jgi:broad specificity phosphatase PhoE